MAIRSYDSVNLPHARLGYSRLLTRPFYLIILCLACIPFLALRFIEAASQITAFSILLLLTTTICTCAAVFVYLNLSTGSTYLLDFVCFRPRSEHKVTKAEFIELSRKSGGFDEESIEYMNQILRKSGIGDETSMPEQVFIPGHTISLNDGREEAAMVMFGAVDDLLAATKIHPGRIGILVVNCGILNTTPSLSAMLINHYKLREDVMSFNLGGMGCSAGIIAIDLASDLLASSPASYAMVVSLEAVTHTWYKGKDRRMLLPNCFFRMGSAAMLLSNRRADGWLRAKYKLQRVVRTHAGSDERSFESVRMMEDEDGKQGICVCADATALGARAVKENVELLENWSAFEHVCVHAASQAALECIQSSLNLSAARMEASTETLQRFGNTSSSSIWYELAYLEAEGKVRNGHRVWQISFGSGLKCNSAVWKALRNIPRPKLSPWFTSSPQHMMKF